MKSTAVAKFRLGGRDFAVVPWGEYQRLTGKQKRAPKSRRLSAQDAGDIAEVKRRAGEPNKSYDDLRRKLGLA